MKIIIIIILWAIYSFAQVDSSYIKSLERDYFEFLEKLNTNKVQQIQLEAILLYIEDKYKKELRRIDSLYNKKQ